jgi:uncharacterized protein (TIGR02145 family)
VLCGGKTYTDAEFCYDNKEIRLKCGGKTYNTSQFCVGGSVYTLCGGSQYDPTEEFCLGGTKTSLCGGKFTYTSSEFCADNGTVYAKCGGTVPYVPGTEACCGNGKYTLATHYCHTDNKTYSCDNQPYNPATHYCHTDGQTYACNNNPYNPSTQFCYENSKVGQKCGTRTDIYNPDLYECKLNINPNGIYLKTPVSYGGKSYEAVLIGEQVWMAENLNYAVEGSKCGNGSILSDNNTSTCDTYGRLYNWATAMGFASSCNSSRCSNQIGTKHGGICPAGWHIPSDAEWTALTDYVDSSKAATKLKAASGWSSGNGTDEYGFSALPGGSGGSSGSFVDVGNGCQWWSATEFAANYAYNRYTGYGSVLVYRDYRDKSNNLYSVRCAQDKNETSPSPQTSGNVGR